ncbi:DUF2726 domain-containing protein [Paucibacter sp. KCTC 42545]|uniref:DUF2726 domain-containing protein n=1 Tax=Paucibacter sp. KCTC 42545 TaxID=1768242 RepID=UPI000733A45B|nr:DUF2726 domain-containing protein [Paucibacter sp. KCTC 42545]ALT78325.1 hypothetical protein AT984_15160 [Paucibacter sp. KCTC 42545]
MPTANLWTIAFALACLALGCALIWSLRRTPQASKPLPSEWALTARPVFSADERRVYRLLKEALPHHIILSKLPLVRFCQPTEAQEVRYWFELLGAIHVTFAICSPNGRVLAAVDLDSDRGISSRSLQIKQSVLGACRVRYLRCPMDNLPSAAELQLLVPYSNSQSRGPQAAPAGGNPSAMRQRNSPARAAMGGRPASGRQGQDLWQDSSMFNDSFFAPDSRIDPQSGLEPMRPPRSGMSTSMANGGRAGLPISPAFAEALSADSHYPDEAPNDIVGMVVDSPRYGNLGPR